ncbi:MAG: serine hydroxymethyltransferase [Anaerolineales bacterium]|nr:serine hydroxymethyltransferase [Anaerolineales bacterium]
MPDSLFRGTLAELDPEVYELTQLESERQYRRLILIASESTSPLAVRDALDSAFQNLYAEGYPDEITRWLSEDEILDYDTRLAHYRRYSNPRYYKGVEYADAIEALARRRCAEAFATNGLTADDLYVNVQPLSGSPANNAVYHALVEPGQTVMGMDLLHGGHLTHGSPANRSGKIYNIVHYTVDPETQRINYQAVRELALENKPKMIIAGYSSYPWAVDWARFRAIADEVGACLLADIAHVAGLVIAGAYPSPVGHAHVITTTTHKTLNGPRGAVIITEDHEMARKVDQAVFPGEQGGPHINVIAALALTFKLAQTRRFSILQHQVVKNCATLTNRLEQRGFPIAFGGTDTHLMNLDCRHVVGSDGTHLSGDMAARILDIAGIVVNRNTIPGDRSAYDPSGIRIGTSWVTQRGFKEKETIEVADIIADVLLAATPYRLKSRKHRNRRAKVDFAVLEDAKLRVRRLAEGAGIDFEPTEHNYPHFYYIDDKPSRAGKRVAFDVGGEHVRQLLNVALSSDIEDLQPSQSQATRLSTPQGDIDGTLTCKSAYEFQLSLPASEAGLAAAWLRALSDGYVSINDDDLLAKSPGPVWVKESADAPARAMKGEKIGRKKPYYRGIGKETGEALPKFTWEEPEENGELKHTTLHAIHQELGAKMGPFAGWYMPVWYSSVGEEHQAVRNASGVFDVSHMGIFQAEGPSAAPFLDSVCGNDISYLNVGESAYTHFLDPDANVIDDLLVYRRASEQYLLVVNAANEAKDWAWLNAVREGSVLVDNNRPWVHAFGRDVVLRNLHDPSAGKDMLVDIALQGPLSQDILLSLQCDEATCKRIRKLKRAELCEVTLGGIDLIVSRTGYTGEPMAFELFVHPYQSVVLWKALLDIGGPMGLQPIGLGARDSLRIEAGLPLYGQEMAGELNLGVGDAGFRNYVKTYKPWFIGRDSFLAREEQRNSEVVRFRCIEKGVRMAHYGDPVLDKRGLTIGFVTSCAADRHNLLTGQAHVYKKYTEVDTPIFLFQGTPMKADGESPPDLQPGDRIFIPTAATVLPRFPKL